MTREEMQSFDDEHAGDFIAVPLNGEFAFGRFLPNSGFAFYDLKLPSVPALEEIEKSPILFILPVQLRALTSGRWRAVGNKPLPEPLRTPVKYFRHPIGTDFVDIYVDDRFQPYSGEDLAKMESLVIWSPRQVEGRLLCHFAGIPHGQTEHFRISRERAEKFRREYFERHPEAKKEA